MVIGNAAEAEINGYEIEWVALPFPGLEINGNYASLDAEFVNFEGGATADLSGNTLPRSPKRKFNLGIQYSFAIANVDELFARVDWTDQSKIYFEASNTPNEVLDGYDILDARAGFRSPDGRWELAFWGKNLGDELVKTHIVAFAPFRQQLNTYQAPRTYGMTFSLSLGE